MTNEEFLNTCEPATVRIVTCPRCGEQQKIRTPQLLNGFEWYYGLKCECGETSSVLHRIRCKCDQCGQIFYPKKVLATCRKCREGAQPVTAESTRNWDQ